MILTSGYWLTIAIYILFFLRLCVTKRRTLIIGSLVLSCMVILLTSVHQWTNKTNLTAEDKSFIIRIKPDQIKVDGNQLQFYGTIEKSENHPEISEKIVVFYTLQSKKEKKAWESQTNIFTVKSTGNLEIPGKNRNQNQFDYQTFLHRKKIHWILKVETFYSMEKTKASITKKMIPENMRMAILKHIDKKITIKTSQYMKTLLFADLSSLDKITVQNFKEIGIIHLLSISGLHIQFFVTGLVYLLWRVGFTKETTFYLMLIILPFYGNLTGWGTSVYRAIVMSLIILISSHFRMIISSLDVWSWTLLSALIINPYQVFSIGFQLSYLLSLVLLILSQTYLTISRSSLVTNFIISFILMLVSIPILSYHFFEFSWIGIFANLLFVPLFTWVLLPVFILLLILSFFLYLNPFFEYSLMSIEKLLTFIEKMVESISELPFITIVTGRVPLFLTILLILSLSCFILTLEIDGKYIKKRILSTSLVVVSLIFFCYYQRYSPVDKVIVIDVGQGDAILIKKSFGKGTYLIDTGGTLTFETKDWQKKENPSSIAKRIVIPTLKSQGISTLDQVLISHGDEDHTGALLELSQSIRVKELLFPVGALKKPVFYKTVLEMTKSGTAIHKIIVSGKEIKFVNPMLAVLWPTSPGKGDNNDSMVLYGKIGSFFWLFTGDIEEGEKKLIQQYPNLKVDVLKVAHHGSQTSSSQIFLNHIQPKYALISCGINNRYNHPNTEVLNRIQKENSHIYRTDRNGAIHFEYIKLGEKVYQESFYTLFKEND
ncbi:DNA internalization-related competence protein ComEC/Rec2 [Carnobacterium funditum]|uniref:DNA internalization-related competence protein ComEC/Rec2 n=1 Tax=Carnobacterium funditum TaxID=2752 RepID=UPI0009FFF617|nr:DNA internalization-related competence protein ComEC/Rec2 [Carnobacterium funditum]